MFSSRTQWDLTPNRLSELVAEKRLRGEAIIDLTESNPTRCGFRYPEKEILSALAHPSSLVYQPEPRGLPIARQAIAEYYARQGIKVSPEHVILTASTSEAYSILFKLVCNVGDEVLVPQPSYPLFEYLCQLNDVALRPYHLAYDGEWHIDFDSLESACTDRSRAIVLVHPNNPTGSYLKHSEYNRVCSIAAAHHCMLIVDEVFGSYNFFSDSHRAHIQKPDVPVLAVSLNGISKLLGLPQLKLAWMLIQNTGKDSEALLSRLDIVADTFLSVNTPVQAALPTLLSYADSLSGQIHSRVHSQYQLLQTTFADSNATVLHSEGGWYAILQLTQSHNDEEWAIELLQKENILVYPGHFFEMEQPSCLVLSLLPPSDLFQTAAGTIRAFLSNR